MPLTVAAYSAMKNLRDRQANLFILDGGIAAAGRRKIRQSIDSNQFRIHWVRPASARLEVMHRKSKNRRIPLPAYFRLLLPEILPQDIYKVISLDPDTIVLKDLAKLWEIDMEDYQFLAVQEPDGPYVIDCFRTFYPDLKDLDFSQFQVTPEHKYFNSGVMVINIQKWRQDGVTEKALNFIESYFPKYPDQDALNVVSAGQWGILDPRWNTTQAFYEKQKNNPYSPEIIDQVVRDPFIVHYTGQAKPWGTGGVRSFASQGRPLFRVRRFHRMGLGHTAELLVESSAASGPSLGTIDGACPKENSLRCPSSLSDRPASLTPFSIVMGWSR